MSNGNHHIDYNGLRLSGWQFSFDTTLRMANKGRFPRPFRTGATEFDALWRTREVRPFLSRPHLAKR